MKYSPKVITSLHRVLQRFAAPRAQLAVFTLVAVLQKAPVVVRSFNTVKYSIEPATRILQRIAVTAASLGTVHAVSGATSAVYSTTNNPNLTVNFLPLTLNQGDSLQLGFSVSNTKEIAGSWSVTGDFPSGLVASGTETGAANAEGVFNDQFGVITGTLTNAGIFTFFLKPFRDANLQGPSAEALEITITVIGSNAAPTLALSIADQNGEGNQAFSLNVSGNFADADSGDTLTYSASLDNNANLPSWLLFDTATGIFSGTPTDNDVATIDVTVTASDAELSISDTFTITVSEERILVIVTVEVSRLGPDFKFIWKTELDQNYQLETSSDAIDWTPDNRGVTEALGLQSVNFTKEEVSQNLFIRVGTELEPAQ